MSKARLTRVTSTGTILKDCLHPQHYYLCLEIEDPEEKILCRMAMSYDQFVQLLVDSSTVTVTLERYRSMDKLVEEEVEMPKSTHDKMIDRLGESHQSLLKRLEDTYQDVYEMVNGDKPNKKKLVNLLHDIDVIKSHFLSNQSFVVKQASEEIEALQDNAKSQLSLFLASKGAQVNPTDLTPMLELPSMKKLPNYTEPINDDYKLKEREQKSIEDMMPMEVADEIHEKFKILEKMQNTNVKEKTVLFHASAGATSAHVHVCYISYQSITKLPLNDAKNYLLFLRTINDIKEFKTHYWYKKNSMPTF